MIPFCSFCTFCIRTHYNFILLRFRLPVLAGPAGALGATYPFLPVDGASSRQSGQASAMSTSRFAKFYSIGICSYYLPPFPFQCCCILLLGSWFLFFFCYWTSAARNIMIKLIMNWSHLRDLVNIDIPFPLILFIHCPWWLTLSFVICLSVELASDEFEQWQNKPRRQVGLQNHH